MVVPSAQRSEGREGCSRSAGSGNSRAGPGSGRLGEDRRRRSAGSGRRPAHAGTGPGSVRPAGVRSGRSGHILGTRTFECQERGVRHRTSPGPGAVTTRTGMYERDPGGRRADVRLCVHRCDYQFEIQQAFTDDALTTCPQCAGRLRKCQPGRHRLQGLRFLSHRLRSSGRKSGSATVSAVPRRTPERPRRPAPRPPRAPRAPVRAQRPRPAPAPPERGGPGRNLRGLSRRGPELPRGFGPGPGLPRGFGPGPGAAAGFRAGPRLVHSTASARRSTPWGGSCPPMLEP